MRKPILAVIVLVAAAALAGWFLFLRGTSHGSAKKPAVTSEGKPTDRARPADADPRGDRESGPQGVLVDDDPKGELQLEGQVVDTDEKPDGRASVSVGSHPPRTVTTE